MRIHEIVLKESDSYMADAQDFIMDLLARIEGEDLESFSTDSFLQMVNKQGYPISKDVLIAILGDLPAVNSVDSEKIVPRTEIPDDQMTDDGKTSDEVTSDLAKKTAKSSIKDDL